MAEKKEMEEEEKEQTVVVRRACNKRVVMNSGIHCCSRSDDSINSYFSIVFAIHLIFIVFHYSR